MRRSRIKGECIWLYSKYGGRWTLGDPVNIGASTNLSLNKSAFKQAIEAEAHFTNFIKP